MNGSQPALVNYGLPYRDYAANHPAAAVGYWLFADTMAHYFSSGSDSNAIRFTHFGGMDDYQRWGRVIARFEELHPDITVKQEYVAGWYGRYDTKLRQQILSRSIPDVVLVQSAPFASIHEHFADLSAQPVLSLLSSASHLNDGGVQTYVFDGAQKALPVWGGTLLIYCNMDCFEKASAFRDIPIDLPHSDWSMDEFIAVARNLTCDFDEDGNIDQFGFWNPRWVYYLPFLWSHGGAVLDPETGEWALHGPRARDAIQFYRELNVGVDRVCPRPDEVSQIMQDVGFISGKVAMCVNGPWFQPFLQQAGQAGRYKVLHIPYGLGGRATRVAWDGIAVATQLPLARRSNALAFVDFVLSPNSQRILTANGRAISARRDFGNPPQSPVGNVLFAESLEYARRQPSLPQFAQIDRSINRHLGALIRQHRPISTEEFLNRLAKDPAIAPLVTTQSSP